MGINYRSLISNIHGHGQVGALVVALQDAVDALQGAKRSRREARKKHQAFEFHAFALLFYLMQPSLTDQQKTVVVTHAQSMVALGQLNKRSQVILYLKALICIWGEQLYFNPDPVVASSHSASELCHLNQWKTAHATFDTWGGNRSKNIQERLQEVWTSALDTRSASADDLDAVPENWHRRPASLTYADMLMSGLYHHAVEPNVILHNPGHLEAVTWRHQKAAFVQMRRSIGSADDWQTHALWVLHMEGALKVAAEDRSLSEWCRDLLSPGSRHTAYGALEAVYAALYDARMNPSKGDPKKRHSLFFKKFDQLHRRYFHLALHRLGDRIGRSRPGKRVVWDNKPQTFGLQRNDRLFYGVFSDYFKAFHRCWIDQSKLVAALRSLHKLQEVLTYEQRVLCKSLVQAFRELQRYKDFSAKWFADPHPSDTGQSQAVDIDPTAWKEHFGDLLICSIWLKHQGNPVEALSRIISVLEQAGPGFFHRLWIYFKQCFFAMTHWAGFTTLPGYSIEQVHARAKASAFEGVMGEVKRIYGQDPTADIRVKGVAPSAQKA